MKIEKLFKLLADGKRLRILMLLDSGELCVCQIMGALGISQPLVSRNLSLLSMAGFLSERREGKLVYYSINKDSSVPIAEAMKFLRGITKGDACAIADRASLRECAEIQKRTGKCDMKTFLEYMKKKRASRKNA